MPAWKDVVVLGLLLHVLLFFPELLFDLLSLILRDRVHLLELLICTRQTGDPGKQPLCCLEIRQTYPANQIPKVCKPKLPDVLFPQLEDEVEKNVYEFNTLFDVRKDTENPKA